MSAPCETVAYSWFVFSLLLSTSILCTAAPQASSETATLVNFFKATSGTRWLNNSGWGIIDTPAAPCDWAGISCDDTGAVVQLVLSNNNLSGSLPDVLNLTNIQVFDVDSNPMLSGTLPSSLGDLVHLQ